MVLCLLSRDSHGDTTKLNHEETIRSPFFSGQDPEKSDSTHSSSEGAINAYFLTGSFSKKTWLFEAVVLVG